MGCRMIPELADRFLSETGVAEYDSYSNKPIAWGRQVIEEIPEDLFDSLRARCEVSCIYPDWFVVERRVQFADLMMNNGGVSLVGLGPGGGFKWVKFADGNIYGNCHFKTGALKQLELNPRLLVKCDRDGKESGKVLRIPRQAICHKCPRAIGQKKKGR